MKSLGIAALILFSLLYVSGGLLAVETSRSGELNQAESGGEWTICLADIHSSFASPGRLIYQSLVSIQPDPAPPGFKRIIIRHALVGDVIWVKVHHAAMPGCIVSNWKRAGQKFTMDVRIPANTTAAAMLSVRGLTGFNPPCRKTCDRAHRTIT